MASVKFIPLPPESIAILTKEIAEKFNKRFESEPNDFLDNPDYNPKSHQEVVSVVKDEKPVDFLHLPLPDEGHVVVIALPKEEFDKYKETGESALFNQRIEQARKKLFPTN